MQENIIDFMEKYGWFRNVSKTFAELFFKKIAYALACTKKKQYLCARF